MNRRDFTRATLSLGAATVIAPTTLTSPASAAETPSPDPSSNVADPLRVAILVHPGVVLLDLVGPQTVLKLAGAEIHLVWKSLAPVQTDVGVPIGPTRSFADCPKDLDVLLVPGGLRGALPLMEDPETLGFLADRGSRARFVTAVCTGSLLLGAAGLLQGYRATSHWHVRDLLRAFGAEPVAARIVEDRNRITGGGVTAGLDFGLALAARLRNEEQARRIQLVLEYDPQPPFDSGSPEKAGEAIVSGVLQWGAPTLAAARETVERARKRFGG